MKHLIGLGRPKWQWVLAVAAQAVPLIGCGGAPSREPARHTPPVQMASLTKPNQVTDAEPRSPTADAPVAAAPEASGPERVLPNDELRAIIHATYPLEPMGRPRSQAQRDTR